MGEKHPYYGKIVGPIFPGSPHMMGFVGFSREPISQAFSIHWIFLPFSMLWEIDEKT